MQVPRFDSRVELVASERVGVKLLNLVLALTHNNPSVDGREFELREEHFQDAISRGAKMVRFTNDSQSALQIVDAVCKGSTIDLQEFLKGMKEVIAPSKPHSKDGFKNFLVRLIWHR